MRMTYMICARASTYSVNACHRTAAPAVPQGLESTRRRIAWALAATALGACSDPAGGRAPRRQHSGGWQSSRKASSVTVRVVNHRSVPAHSPAGKAQPTRRVDQRHGAECCSLPAKMAMERRAPIAKPPRCAAKSRSGEKLTAMIARMETPTVVACEFRSWTSRGSVWFQVMSMKLNQAPMRPQRAPEEPTLRWPGIATQLARVP
mmetsp:Transcript_86045/g.244065  ORF Transcript_86045/g.244065 Transcript_86045/m.244065 type:complete len:205 (+) Transcript_86045:204-818(+)